jgi:Protein of unknown function (DUF1488)
VPKTPKSGAELERNQVPLSAEITCRFQPKSGAGLLRFLQPQARMFFTFPENIRWDPERQAVEFRVEIGEYQGVVRVARHVLQRLLPERPRLERCVEAYYLQRTRFESITERKLRRRQLTEDGNVEITGRDLRGGPAAAPRSARS